MTPLLEVMAPGLLSTIQDMGRPDAAPLGVPRSGASDPWSLAIANLLLGNERDAAALEVTVAGPELLVLTPCTVAVSGADLGATDGLEDRALTPGGSYRLRAGSTLLFRGAPADVVSMSARSYLAVAGGFEVPMVLGSASTCLAGRFGGLEGRALRTGDRLAVRGVPDGPVAGARWSGATPMGTPDAPIRLLPGPHTAIFGSTVRDRLVTGRWTVGAESDRMGLRLEGQPIPSVDADKGTIVSIPVTWGAIQLPPGGHPIVLLADHQTVGGYPVVAVVCTADLGRLGQLAPGASVRFAWTDHETAVAALRSQVRAFDGAAVLLRRTDAWDRLVEAAEG